MWTVSTPDCPSCSPAGTSPYTLTRTPCLLSTIQPRGKQSARYCTTAFDRSPSQSSTGHTCTCDPLRWVCTSRRSGRACCRTRWGGHSACWKDDSSRSGRCSCSRPRWRRSCRGRSWGCRRSRSGGHKPPPSSLCCSCSRKAPCSRICYRADRSFSCTAVGAAPEALPPPSPWRPPPAPRWRRQGRVGSEGAATRDRGCAGTAPSPSLPSASASSPCCWQGREEEGSAAAVAYRHDAA
jgi:hypothetical protein